MNMVFIYESKQPKFAIFKDDFQWILTSKQANRGEWANFSYFPNLSNLLDGLAEEMFKKNTKKIKELKELDKSIDKVYDLIYEVSAGLEKRF